MASLLRPKVLIVEDEGLIRLDLVDTFEAAGFTTFDAPDAEQALGLLKTNTEIAWVFTDVDLGGAMDGMDLAQCVHGRWPGILISICSGKSPDRARMPPGVPFLPKPYDSARLRQHIAARRDQLNGSKQTASDLP